MNAPRSNHPFRFSLGLYRRLLWLYPAQHRAKYGAAMVQLFRDQCRDARLKSPTWGLAALWLRTLSDLASTSVAERLAALKERKTMTDKLGSLFAFRTTPLTTRLMVFIPVFVVVFLSVFIGSVAITFILPETYASTARVKIEAFEANTAPDALSHQVAAMKNISSAAVLERAIAQLKLNEEFGKKYYNGEILKTSETMELLKHQLRLAPVQNTSLIAITLYSDDPEEAARIANAVAEAYRDIRQEARSPSATSPVNALAISDSSPIIIDTAVPERVPVRPNKPLNILLGAIVGAILASAAGASALALLLLVRRRKSQPS
jgi:capsular polysaccharide biosynthesis protein